MLIALKYTLVTKQQFLCFYSECAKLRIGFHNLRDLIMNYNVSKHDTIMSKKNFAALTEIVQLKTTNDYPSKVRARAISWVKPSLVLLASH